MEWKNYRFRIFIYEFLLFDLELQTEEIILLLILRVYKNAKAIWKKSEILTKEKFSIYGAK